MSYDKDSIFETAKAKIIEHKLLFIEEVISFLPCTKTTFYEFFPSDSEQSNIIKALINENKVSIKTRIRNKWDVSDSTTAQLLLYKLCGTKEERLILSDSPTDTEDLPEVKQSTPILPTKTKESIQELIDKLKEELDKCS